MAGGFPSVITILRDALRANFPQLTDVVAYTQLTLQETLPVLAVHVGGGPRDQVNWQTTASLTLYAPTVAVAEQLAEDIDTFLTQHRPRGLDTVATESAPDEVPWADPNTVCFAARYRVVVRRLR